MSIIRTILIILLTFLFGCTPVESNKVVVNEEQSIFQDDSLEYQVNDINKENDSVSKFLNKPIDFYEFKKNVHMLNSSNFILGNDFFHSVEDSNYIFYHYLAIEMDSGNDRSLSFKVLKPWSTPQDKYYSSDNEILVGIKSKIPLDALKPSNFVGKSENQVVKQLGEPNYIKNECLVYYRNDKILILKSNNKNVSWFKYVWLKKNFELLNELPDELYQW